MKRNNKLCVWLIIILLLCAGCTRKRAKSKGIELVFASDRHSNTSAVYQTMKKMPIDVSYVALIGDMVDRTEYYKSSTLLEEVHKVLPAATVQMIWGSHDANVDDDAGIVVNSSSCIRETDDYYVYSIAYDDMRDTSKAEAGAKKLKEWAGQLNDQKPVFVVSHVPMHAKRGDNVGATYWHEALQYLSTGGEGTKIKRAVVFFHGHNHTVDKEEYYYKSLSTINLQGKTGSSHKPRKRGEKPSIEANNTVSTVIYYTYITAGYLNENTSATLVSIDQGTITFTKYAKGKSTELGSVKY